MVKLAYIFPGQGSQSTGMGLDLCENFESAKQVYDNADKILNKKISDICFNGPDEELKKTINAQSAIVATSLAAFSAFRELCPELNPTVTLGHSLGEYCALYCAGVLDFETTIKAIQKRSELMDVATKDYDGAMAAIIGLDIEKIKETLDEVSSFGIAQIANYNDKSQIVITGEKEAILKACEIMKEKGAKRALPLAVSGGFHSKLMNSATEGFCEFVKTLELNDAKIPVITNIDAQATQGAQEFREKMPNQINSSVMWYQSIEKALEMGVEAFIEFGNGKVLSGLNKKICPEIKTYNVFDKESLMAVVNELTIGV